MNCRNCGTPLVPGAAFCRQCGAPVNVSQQPLPQQPLPQQPMQPPLPQPPLPQQPLPQQPLPQQPQPQKRRKPHAMRKKALVVALVCVLLVTLGVIALLNKPTSQELLVKRYVPATDTIEYWSGPEVCLPNEEGLVPVLTDCSMTIHEDTNADSKVVGELHMATLFDERNRPAKYKFISKNAGQDEDLIESMELSYDENDNLTTVDYMVPATLGDSLRLHSTLTYSYNKQGHLASVVRESPGLSGSKKLKVLDITYDQLGRVTHYSRVPDSFFYATDVDEAELSYEGQSLAPSAATSQGERFDLQFNKDGKLSMADGETYRYKEGYLRSIEGRDGTWNIMDVEKGRISSLKTIDGKPVIYQTDANGNPTYVAGPATLPGGKPCYIEYRFTTAMMPKDEMPKGYAPYHSLQITDTLILLSRGIVTNKVPRVIALIDNTLMAPVVWPRLY